MRSPRWSRDVRICARRDSQLAHTGAGWFVQPTGAKTERAGKTAADDTQAHHVLGCSKRLPRARLYYSPGWKASPTTLRLLRSARSKLVLKKKKISFQGDVKRLKLDTGTPEPEPEVEMAELYVQYERSPYFDRQSGMTLEVLGLTEPIYILSSSSRPSARLLAPLLLFPPLPRSSCSLAHLCCRSTTQQLRRRAACTWGTFPTSQRKLRSMTSSTARGR